MKTKMLLAGVTAGVMFAGSVLASTLDDVRARGKLNCIINTGLAGFAAPDDKGNWTGFDVDFCRAVAAATLGDASKVNYTTATGKTRFTKLAAGEGEILSRNTTVQLNDNKKEKTTGIKLNMGKIWSKTNKKPVKIKFWDTLSSSSLHSSQILFKSSLLSWSLISSNGSFPLEELTLDFTAKQYHPKLNFKENE